MLHSSNWILLFATAASAACLFVCASASNSSPSPDKSSSAITEQPFGTADGMPVHLYTLRNKHGVEARICNYGGLVISLKVPDKNGHFDDVVLGYDKLDDYLKESPYFGALIGRYGNRI